MANCGNCGNQLKKGAKGQQYGYGGKYFCSQRCLDRYKEGHSFLATVRKTFVGTPSTNDKKTNNVQVNTQINKTHNGDNHIHIHFSIFGGSAGKK